MRWASVVVVVVVGCGGTAATPKPVAASWKLPADATMGVCADGVTPGVTGPAALLDAARSAQQRGCPREAILDAQAVRATGDAAQKAAALLVLVEAGQDARTSTLFGDAEPTALLTDEPWFTSSEIETPDAIRQLAGAISDGTLDARARDEGRLIRIVVRYTLQSKCLPSLAQQTDFHVSQDELLNLVLKHHGRQFFAPKSGGMLAGAGAALLWRCDLKGAAARYTEAAAEEARAGRKPERLAALLAAWAAAELPGGRAVELGMNLPSPFDEIGRRARELEAARLGAGEMVAIGKKASAALDAIVRDTGIDEASDAQLLWLRSMLALRYLGKAADAARLAAQAEARAIATRRADVLDAARMIGALAAIEQERHEDARRLLAFTYASLGRRGAVGAIHWVSTAIQTLTLELQRRGRPADALALVTAARDGLGDRAPTERLALAALVARSLAEHGRLEDALVEYEAIASTPRPKHQILGQIFATMMQGIADNTARLREELGLAVSRPDDSDLGKIIAAIEEGNLAPLRTTLDDDMDPEHLALVPWMCAARPADIAAAADELAKQLVQARTDIASLDAGPQLFELSMQFVQAIAQMGEVSDMVMSCGARIRNPAVYRAGAALAKATIGASESAAAFEAEATGKLSVAAAKLEKIGRTYANAITEAGAVGTSKRAGDLLERAALVYLDDGAPLARVVGLLEESRARSLRAARASRRASTIDPVQGAVVEVERKAVAALARVRALTKLLADASGPTRGALERALVDGEKELERLEGQRDEAARRLRTMDPHAYRAAALSAPPSLPEMQKQLGADEVLVYYVIKELEAWAIVIDRAGARPVKLAALDARKLPRIEPAIRRYRAAVRAVTAGRALRKVRAKPDATLETLREELYRMIVAPIEAHVAADKRVIIIPDELTADLAFAELGTPSRPWIERNPIRVLPNARLLFDVSRGKLDKRRALVVGDPDFTGAAHGVGEEAWPQLPATRTEATQIAGRLGVAPLLGIDASEKRVHAALPGASLIHLATHGLADLGRPSYSKVVLSHPPSDTASDGLLHAYEIERLRLQASLVVLSACETGRGNPRGSEGMLALDRAFLVAGAGSVISSLWVVPDDATSALMIELYRQLDAGKPIDVALAVAMRAVRAESRWADPRNWAAFRVVGAGLR